MVEVSKRILLQVIFTSICAILYLRTLYHYPSENSNDIYSSLKQCSNQSLTQRWFRKVRNQTQLDSNSLDQFDDPSSSFQSEGGHHVNTWVFTVEDWISWLNDSITPSNETAIEIFEAEKLPELQGMPCARWGQYNGTLHPIFAILTMKEQSTLNNTLYSLLCEAGADPSSVFIFSYADTDRDSVPTREVVDRYHASLVVLNASSPLITQKKFEKLYRCAFDYVFNILNQTYLVILEDDLQPAPDIVTYFDGISKIMDYDPSISCASAWNDLGYPAMSMNEHILRRTNSFLNLGWMLSRWYYEKTIYPILRDNPDMDWINVQHKAMRENRLDCVFPEVPRVHHALKQNHKSPTANWMQRDFFDNMLLADKFNVTLDFGRISQESYQAYLEGVVSNALQLEDLTDTLYFRNTVFTYYCSKCRQTNFQAWNDIITNIFGFHKSNLGDRSPQGIYQNTMFIGLYTNQVLLVASDSPHRKNLSNHYAAVTPTQKRTVEYELFKKIFIGSEGLSCDETCKSLKNQPNLSCHEQLLHTFNNCSVLQRFMRLSREGSCSGECIVNRDFHFPAVRLLPGTDRMYSCTTTYARYVNCQAKPPPGYRRLCYCE